MNQIIFAWCRGAYAHHTPYRRFSGSLSFPLLGAAGRNRTTDTGIFSPLLYRLSYRPWCLRMESNHLSPKAAELQSAQLPHTDYTGKYWKMSNNLTYLSLFDFIVFRQLRLFYIFIIQFFSVQMVGVNWFEQLISSLSEKCHNHLATLLYLKLVNL